MRYVALATRVIAFLATAALVGDALATVFSGALAPRTGGFRPAIAAKARPGAERFMTEALPERFRPILHRNLFGVLSQPVSEPPPSVATKSSLMERYELVGTVVAANPVESRAVVRPRGSDGGARTLLAGSALDETRVVRIEQRRVVVDASGRLEALAFELDATDESAAEPGAAPAPTSAPDSAVTRAGDGTYEIEAETFRRVGADPARLMRDASFVPNTGRTGTDGWRVFAVKPGSLFAQLGLVDGDVVRAIDATRLSGLDATLAGLTALRDAHAFEVTVERGQIERTLRYRVR